MPKSTAANLSPASRFDPAPRRTSAVNARSPGCNAALAAVIMVSLASPSTAAPRPEAPGSTGGPGASLPDNPAPVTAGKAADCSDRVAQAFEKQREAGSFRMKTRMFNERGVVFMTVDYVLPLKMKQRVKVLSEPEAVETILIAEDAWSTASGKWQKLSGEMAQTLSKEMQDSVVSPPNDPLAYECAGTSEIDGRNLEHFTAAHRTLTGKVEANTPIRHVFVDPDSGLPLRNTVTPVDEPEKPFFQADYSYPTDISIDPPAVAGN